MWYLWATEPPQKAWVKYGVCRKKRRSKPAVKAEWKSGGDPESQSQISWKVNVKKSLIFTLCLFLWLSSLPASLSLSPSFSSHKHTDARKRAPPHYERNQLDPLSPVLFFPPSFSPSPTVVFWTSNPEPLSLADSPLFIPRSQRAFFNTQCTNSLVRLVCACACGERKRESKIAKERHKETKKRGEREKERIKMNWRACVCVKTYMSVTHLEPLWSHHELLSLIVPACLPVNPNTSAHL